MATIIDPQAVSRASSYFNLREDRITITRPSNQWFAEGLAMPLDPFKISKTILATVSGHAPKISGGIIGVLQHLTWFPSELCFMMLEHLTYRDLVLLALTSKSMAIPILADPTFAELATAEEAEHNTLGHFQIVINAFPNLSQHRSKLWCTHYTCPFHMRRLRNWNRNVAKEMELLKEKKDAEEHGQEQMRDTDEQPLLGVMASWNMNRV